jgi:histidinol phosphatase-like enzyme (inositol monophosphatase family)
VTPPTVASGTSELLQFAERLADESRRLLRGTAMSAIEIGVKADNSLVTELDRSIEARLRDLIARAYPEHGILGEEYGAHHLDAEVVWVLDPVDGTAPFIAGIPVYGTLVGVSLLGKPWIGVLDYPATGDRWAGVNGAFARHNGAAVRTRRCAGLGSALATCSNPDFFGPDDHPALGRIRKEVRYILYGGSSFAFGVLASGRTDLSVDCGLKPYDIFAPAAVIGGAGGVMTEWSGAELTLGSTGRVVAAGDRGLHEMAVALLRG